MVGPRRHRPNGAPPVTEEPKGDVTLVSTFGCKLFALLVLLTFASSFGESPGVVTQLRSFNVHGTVRIDRDEVISGAEVIFKGEGGQHDCVYRQKGPLRSETPGRFLYFVVPRKPGFKTYQRPLFRVTATTDITWNVSIWPGVFCDYVEVPQGSEHTPTEGEITDSCGGWELFPVPSQDGVPFQLLIYYTARQRTDRGSVYLSRSSQDFKTPVFVAYNLFTLLADRVTYDEKTRTLEAHGNVVAFNEKGETQTAGLVTDSMTFRIENRGATRLP
jgi:hypothetical protein